MYLFSTYAYNDLPFLLASFHSNTTRYTKQKRICALKSGNLICHFGRFWTCQKDTYRKFLALWLGSHLMVVSITLQSLNLRILTFLTSNTTQGHFVKCMLFLNSLDISFKSFFQHFTIISLKNLVKFSSFTLTFLSFCILLFQQNSQHLAKRMHAL